MVVWSRRWAGRPAVGAAAALLTGATAAAAAWALVADGKDRWATVSGASGAVVAFVASITLPAVQDWADRQTQRRRAAAKRRASELPASVAWLLHPDKAVVTFFGRERILAELEHWCRDQSAAVVRLVAAPGGYGKTRLARELRARLGGWEHQPVPLGEETEVAEALADGGGRTLLFLDYADSRDAAGVAAPGPRGRGGRPCPPPLPGTAP